MRWAVLLVYTFCIVTSAVINGEEFLLGTKYGVFIYRSGVQSGYRTLMNSSDYVSSLDYHFSKKLLFAVSNNTLFRSALEPGDNSDVGIENKQLVKESLQCSGFTVDWVHDRIYAANCSNGTGTVLAFGLNGEAQKTVISWSKRESNQYPQGLENMVIDPYKGILFWVHNEVIQSIETSGEGFNPDMNPANTSVRMLALDIGRRRVYYVGGTGDIPSLYSMDYTGGEVVEHASSVPLLSNLYGLSILRDKLFWVNDLGKDFLYEAPLNISGPDDVTIVEALEKHVYSMKLLHPSLQERPTMDPRVATGEFKVKPKCPPGQTLLKGISCHVVGKNAGAGVIFVCALLVLGVALANSLLVK